MEPIPVYRTESGMLIRIWHRDDGQLCVEELGASGWEPAPSRFAGLRLSSTTRRLTPRQVAALPD